MIWVVGSTSSGMHTYTKHTGGHIESDERLRRVALKRYHKIANENDYIYAETLYLKRKLMQVPTQADCVNFMFMDMIDRLDSDCTFVWLVRKHEEIVDSLMVSCAEEERIHPKGWKFSNDNKRDLLTWYVKEVDYLINKSLIELDRPFKKVDVKDLICA
jgi:hypothetical protein